MRYIDAYKLIAEIESRMEDCKLPDGRFPTTTNIVRYEELSCLRNFITSLQQEQPDNWDDEYREDELLTRFAFYTYKDEDGVLYLSNVFVEETSRNKGFGAKILQAAEKVAETIGANTIRLKAKRNSQANDWYRKHGYGYLTFEGEYDWLEKKLEYLKPKQEQPDIIDYICLYAGIPAPFMDGNQWCILKGDNIQVGVVGFGDTKEDALINFIKDIPLQHEPAKGIDGVVHHYLNTHWIVTDKKQLATALKVFPEGAEVELFIFAKKDGAK